MQRNLENHPISNNRIRTILYRIRNGGFRHRAETRHGGPAQHPLHHGR